MKRKALALILAALMALTTMVVVPAGAEASGDWEYTVNDGAVTITKYIGAAEEITLPNEIGGYPVTEIGERAFSQRGSLKKVTISDSVTTIGKEAFNQCRYLKSIDIPDSVTSIGSGAFYECRSLTDAVIPNGVTHIELRTFRYCQSLTSVTIPKSVTNIDVAAFNNCISLKTVNYGGTQKQWNAISIDEYNASLLDANIIVVADGTVNPDVNADGNINSRDAIAIMRLIVGFAGSDVFSEAADVNGDGRVNVRDVIAIMKAILAQQ